MAVEPECWAGLSGFAQLRKLVVNWDRPLTPAQRSALVHSVHALPHLSDLTLNLGWQGLKFDNSPFTLQLPALRSLDLRRVRLPSLSFLQHSPLHEQLDLAGCVGMNADDTVHCLQTLAPRLHRLRLYFSVHLSAEQESLLRPPSALLPALTDFIHTHAAFQMPSLPGPRSDREAQA